MKNLSLEKEIYMLNNAGLDFVDPFDLSKIRLSLDFDSSKEVKKLLTVVPVKKPNSQDFVRVHPSEEMRIQTNLLIIKDGGESYLASPGLWNEIPSELTPVFLFLAINRQRVLFLWPIKIPDRNGRKDNWNRSSLDAAREAEKSWVRVQANMSGGYYDVHSATGSLTEPEWPELSLQEIVRIAFRDKFIDSPDHPVLRTLRGEI